MKKGIILSLVASIMLASPALASHHEGHGKKDMGNHAKNMEMMMNAHKMYGERGVDLMTMGNDMIAKGYAKKDAKMMMHGAEMLKTGKHMHQASMHAMKETLHELKHHVMHAKVGDMKMSDAEMKDVTAKMDMLKAEMKKHHELCNPQSAKMPQSAEMLMKMGNDMVMAASKSGDDQKAMHGMNMMKMAMKMLMPGHGHEKKEIRIEKEVRMSH